MGGMSVPDPLSPDPVPSPAAVDFPRCDHAPTALAAPSGARCEECGSAVSLRACAHCGHVGCCESQAGHARAHALEQAHPVILSLPLGRGFTWCYAENAYIR